ITPSGQSVEVTLSPASPGLFTGSLETREIGLYQIGNGDLTALAHVGPVNAPEVQDTVSTTDVLRPAASASGGSVRRLGNGAGVSLPGIVPVRAGGEASGRDWIGLKTTGDSVLKSVDRMPLFAGFFGLALLIFALGSRWYREGR